MNPPFYPLLRKLLFLLPPEVAHTVALGALDWSPFRMEPIVTGEGPIEVMGLRFPNRLGLAAGLDKNGDHVNALGGLGFGFIEIGTVTPRPQAGNSRPRLFRLPEAQALINRMGFNNKGVDYLVERVQQRRYAGVLGINVGKNFSTPVERALDDYLIGLRKVFPVADYVTVNISSPNTPGLRDLQQVQALEGLLGPLKTAQQALQETHARTVPLAVKVAPDLAQENIEMMAEVFNRLEIDAVIATNTTLARDGVAGIRQSDEAGGLSGRPLFSQATAVTRAFRSALRPEVALIAAGGVFTREDFLAKRAAGAELVQVYTGFIYRGPGIVRELLDP